MKTEGKPIFFLKSGTLERVSKELNGGGGKEHHRERDAFFVQEAGSQLRKEQCRRG